MLIFTWKIFRCKNKKRLSYAIDLRNASFEIGGFEVNGMNIDAEPNSKIFIRGVFEFKSKQFGIIQVELLDGGARLWPPLSPWEPFTPITKFFETYEINIIKDNL